MDFSLRLSKEQIERALTLLGKHPYVETADIIDAVKAQVTEALQTRREQAERALRAEGKEEGEKEALASSIATVKDADAVR